jgi:thiol-disulfide isomerase/thioredoxin
MRYLIILLWVTVVQIYGQDFINSKDFNKIVNSNQPIVIEFWAEFNDKNKWSYLGELKKCGVYRSCIVVNKDLADEFGIKVLPTIILFNNRKEVSRWEGNLMFQLSITKKTVQSKIDSIIINQFK